MTARTGPPGEAGGGPTPEAAGHHQPGPHHDDQADREFSGQADIGGGEPPRRQCGDPDPRPWRRRREASWRLPPLGCACRTADPWCCRCNPPPLTEKTVDAGAAAARHLLAIGCAPIIELDTLRALHRRDGHDRALAEQLHHMTGGQVA